MIRRLAITLALALCVSTLEAQTCTTDVTLRLSKQPTTCAGGTNAGNICFEDSQCPGSTCVNTGSPATCIGGSNNGNACEYSSVSPLGS
jgi:hypothetical protein